MKKRHIFMMGLGCFTVFIVMAVCFLNIHPTLAADPPPISLENPLTTDGGPIEVQEVIGRLLKGFLALSGAAALIMFIWGGMQMLMSQGKPDVYKKGLTTLVWAIIGIAMVFGSYVIVHFIFDSLLVAPRVQSGGENATFVRPLAPSNRHV